MPINLIMQLLYPWFLVALSAIAIPIAIHLLQLRKPQRIFFSNTAFIKDVELVMVRHRKVQHLLILLSRVIAISALIVAFSQPYISNNKNESALRTNEAVNVLVDNSFSMQLQGVTQGSLFEEVVAEARELGIGLATRAGFRLVGQSSVLNKSAYLDKLDELKISARNPYGEFALERSDERNGILYVFSDFQKQAFANNLLTSIGTGREVVLVPVVGKKSGNIYVDSVWLDDAFVRARTNVGLHVRVRNGGGLVATDCAIKVFLGGQQVAAFRVTVEAGAAITSVVQVQVKDGALALGRVVTEDGPVTFDNTYYFTLRPAETIQVLEIGPQPVAQSVYGNEPLFRYAFAKPQSVNYAKLLQANVVLLNAVSGIDAGLLDGLRAVLKRGGSVVVVPSVVEASRSAYQRLFKQLGLGEVQWEAKSARPELREVAMPSRQEPFFRDVFGANQRDVTMPRVAPVLQWARTGTDILRLRDGGSYLAGFASGAGKVYVFSAPFAKDYSDFVTHALFVPVMYRMAMLSYRNEQLPAYRLGQGTTVALGLTREAGSAQGGADAAGFRLVKDSLTLIPAQRVVGQEVRLDLPVGMDTPGFYRVQRGGKVLTTLAFNQDKRESELAAYSADELRQMIGPNRPNIRVLEGGADGRNLAKFQAEQTARPLWRYFVALALVGLLAEALLIRFGSRRGGAAVAKQGV